MEDDPEEEGVEVFPKHYTGNKSWVDMEGFNHRINGPAVIYKDGDMLWYRHGKLHRDDGPAVDWPSESRFIWYKHGERYEPSAHELMVWKMMKKKGS